MLKFQFLCFTGSIEAQKIDHPQITELKPTLMTAMNTDTPMIRDTANFCFYDSRKYAFGEHFEIGCESVCTCFAASRTVECEPRCPQKNTTREQCVTVPDPNDACCHIEFCDVTLDDHDELGTQTMTTMANQTSKDVTKGTTPITTTAAIQPTTTTTTTSRGDEFDTRFDDDGEYHCVHNNGRKYKIGMDYCCILVTFLIFIEFSRSFIQFWVIFIIFYPYSLLNRQSIQ